MLKHLVGFARQLFTVTGKVQQHETDIRDLREGLKRISDQLETLAGAIEQLHLQQVHHRELASRDFENLVLRLENYLLRAGMQVPHGSLPSHSAEAEEA